MLKHFRIQKQIKMVEGKGAAQEQEVDYEFFKAGIDGRKEGQQATDKRPGESSLFNNNSLFLMILTFLCHAAMIGGLLGAGGVAYMAKQFKNRPKDMKISVYLIHTRMYAQMTVVGKLNLNMPSFLAV